MSNICPRAKVMTAAIGAAVVVAMGALTVTLSGTEAHAVTAHLKGPGSSIQTTPPPVPQTPNAMPPVKAKKWTGKGWPGP
jgi:hypothetical protein